MENQAVMNEVIMKAVAEATRIAIQAFMETQSQRPENQQGSKLGGPALRQPQFNWEANDKYTKWKAFILEVRNVLSTYKAQDQKQNCHSKELARQERVPLFRKPNRSRKKWACNTLQGLFYTLAAKFKPQFNETVKLLQFRKLCRFKSKSAEEWMGRL